MEKARHQLRQQLEIKRAEQAEKSSGPTELFGESLGHVSGGFAQYFHEVGIPGGFHQAIFYQTLPYY